MRDANREDARLATSGAVTGTQEIRVCGEMLTLRADRSLFWPRRRWLIVADLHLGKAESLRRDGVALPDRVMDEDLARLRRAVLETRAERLLVLGDLVHDARGMTSALVRRVAAWRATITVSMALVPGNHDRRVAQLPAEWRIEVQPAKLSMPPFDFTHDPCASASVAAASATGTPADGQEPAAGLFSWHGHLHPVVSLRGPGDRLRLPCFALAGQRGVLPAFTTLAGGSEQWRAAGARCWVAVDGRVIEVPVD